MLNNEPNTCTAKYIFFTGVYLFVINRFFINRNQLIFISSSTFAATGGRSIKQTM